MAGHSKWSKIKHKKAANDAQKGKIFSKLAKEITVAVKEGGGADEALNYMLRSVLDRAKTAKMPSSSIETAIEKGMGVGKEGTLERIIYEGYAISGVAIIVETLTDNRNRTVSSIRFILGKHEGELGESGSVMWKFDCIGLIRVEKSVDIEDILNLLIDVEGVLDITEEGNEFYIKTENTLLQSVREVIDKGGYCVKTADKIYQPKDKIAVKNIGLFKSLLLELEEDDDIINVWHNARL